MEFVLLISLVLFIQVFIFFYVRKRKKQMKKSFTILDKYKIRNRSDLFNRINGGNIPEEDRLALEEHYQKGFS